MTEIALSLLSSYGVPILATITFLSCLALPVPSSLAMLSAGGFAATGDLTLSAVAAAAFFGAVLGDNAGYWLARLTGVRMSDWFSARPGRAKLRDRATAYMDKRGGPSLFFSCWLVAPLGPTMNYVSGMTRFPWHQFVLWGIAGEIVWVTIYVGLGYAFGDNLTEIASLVGNVSGFLAALAVMIGLGIWLYRVSHNAPIKAG